MMPGSPLLRACCALLIASALAGCGLDEEGMILVLDRSYAPELLLTEKDGITSPDGLLWEDGHLVIADEGGSALRLWTPGRPVATLASREQGLRSPEDVVRGADGSLYWTDDDTGGLWRLGANGGISQPLKAADGLPSTEGLAASPSGAILVGDGEKSRVVRLDPDGKATPLPLAIDKPESMALDDAGNLYIADNRAGTLYMIGRDGRLYRPIAHHEGFSPESIRWANGALFITDSDDGKLFRYTPAGGLEALAVFGGDYAEVQGVTTDPQGNIYLSFQTDLKGGRGMILRLRRTGPQ